MALEKQVAIDKIEVMELGQIQVRQITRIMEDGNEISKTYHRSSLAPEQDLTGVPANVVAICNTAWTDEVKTAYRAMVEAQTRGA